MNYTSCTAEKKLRRGVAGKVSEKKRSRGPRQDQALPCPPRPPVPKQTGVTPLRRVALELKLQEKIQIHTRRRALAHRQDGTVLSTLLQPPSRMRAGTWWVDRAHTISLVVLLVVVQVACIIPLSLAGPAIKMPFPASTGTSNELVAPSSMAWTTIAGIAASIIILASALFGCIKSGKQDQVDCPHCGNSLQTDPAGLTGEVEFWSNASRKSDSTGGDILSADVRSSEESKAASRQTEIRFHVDQLGAVYNTLGQVVADIKELESELEALTNAKETAQKPDDHEKMLIAPMQDELNKAKEHEASLIKNIIEMRNRFAESAMPKAKECEKQYSSIFLSEGRNQDGSNTPALEKICSIVKNLEETLPSSPPGEGKAARQPGVSADVAALQEVGVREAEKMYGEVMLALYSADLDDVQLDGSSVCRTIKSASRAFEKSYARWGGNFLTVTDWGRATVCALTLTLLAQALDITLKRLTELGYSIVAVKNTLDRDKDCTANGGYRNLMMNVKCADSGHVLEIQFNLSPIEKIKQNSGHVIFELLRRCGFTKKNSVVKGGWTPSVDSAIRCGRAIELQFSQANWSLADARALKLALAAPGCRVIMLNGELATGEGAGDMVEAAAGSKTIQKLE